MTAGSKSINLIPRPIPRKTAGFTLVEILAVLMIIGLMTGVVVVSLPPPPDPLIKQGQELKSDIAGAAEAAVIRQKPYGVILHKNSVDIVRYQNGLWQTVRPISMETVGHPTLHLLQNGLAVDLEKAEKLGIPLIRFDATGLATPFELRLESGAKRYILRGSVDGSLSSEVKS